MGLNRVMTGGLMESIEWFFDLHDKDHDGFLTKDEVIQLSESLLVSVNVSDEAYHSSSFEMNLEMSTSPRSRSSS